MIVSGRKNPDELLNTSDHIQNVLDLVIDVIQDDLDLIVMFRG